MAALTSLAFALFVVIVSWITVGAAIAGIGSAVSRLWRPGDEDASHHAPFWIGLGVVIAFLQIWTCFLPISAVPLIVVFALGLPAFFATTAWHWRDRSAAWKGAWLIAFLFIALWLADRALASANASDTGL